MTPLRRNRDFALLWSGQVVSSIGTSAATIAYPLLALATTGSATRAGLIGAAGATAMVIGSLPAGVWADRHPIRVLMIGCHALRALVAISVVTALLADRLTFSHLLLAATVTQFCGPTAFASETIAVRHVVPPDQLASALAQNEARGHLADLTGRPLGGYLYGLAAALPIVADGASFLVSAATVLGVRGSLNADRVRPPHASMGRQISVGLRHVWRTPFLRTTLLCSAGINIAFAGLTLAVIASQSTQGASQLGMALGIGSLGGVAGAWMSTRLLSRLPPATVIFGFGWIVAAALVAIGQAHDVYALSALLATIQFVTAPANGVLFATQIHVTPPEMQGRVISAAITLLGATTPLGPLLAGLLVERAGQGLALAVLGGIVAVSTLILQCSGDVRTMPDLRVKTALESSPRRRATQQTGARNG